MTLGLSMIAKNESAVIARALDSVKDVVDEIVVVDTGSTDDTFQIARKYTDKVFVFDWVNDFSAARNFALSKTSCDYFMWLDADDVVPPATARAIRRVMTEATADIIMLPYVIATDKNGKPLFSYLRERIIKTGKGYFWQGAVHEAVELRGNIIKLNKPIIHAKPTDRINGTRNLDIYLSMIEKGRKLSPREQYYFGRELYYNGRTADAARVLKEFIFDKGGSAANKADACTLLSRCHSALGDKQSAYLSATQRFAFVLPDGEGCCRVGELFFADGNYKAAAYWYERALRSKPDIDSGAFVQADYFGFIPLMWLTVCYDKMGDAKTAFRFHRRAKKLSPDDKGVIANSAYFASKGLFDT